MTAHNQPHKYRCETCDHFQTRFEYGNKKMCMKIRERFSNSYQIGLPLYTEIIGCASHPSAIKAEQRIADVIKELERLTHCKHVLDDGSCRYDETCDHCNIGDFIGSIYEIKQQIALLRGKEE